jgi:hypothetical protein
MGIEKEVEVGYNESSNSQRSEFICWCNGSKVLWLDLKRAPFLISESHKLWLTQAFNRNSSTSIQSLALVIAIAIVSIEKWSGILWIASSH